MEFKNKIELETCIDMLRSTCDLLNEFANDSINPDSTIKEWKEGRQSAFRFALEEINPYIDRLEKLSKEVMKHESRPF